MAKKKKWKREKKYYTKREINQWLDEERDKFMSYARDFDNLNNEQKKETFHKMGEITAYMSMHGYEHDDITQIYQECFKKVDWVKRYVK